MVRAFLWIIPLLVSAGCRSLPDRTAHREWLNWRKLRAESVAGTNGWTTVIGLHWLREGTNTTGTAPGNDIVIEAEHGPPFLGAFLRQGANVLFRNLAGEEIGIFLDTAPKPTRLQFGTISIVVIQRGERVGLRIRDTAARARREFTGLHRFDYNPQWCLEGRYIPFANSRKLRVPDVTGGLQEFESPGEVAFSVEGREYRLAVALEPDVRDFFVMFHDETAGDATYPAGRYLYVKKPGQNGRVTVDFNHAYTPPCGFTLFATCPIPPRQNWLPFAIRAGELKPVPLK